jgi:hypothetical protein
MRKYIYRTKKEWWLIHHGDRTVNDVWVDEIGEYVLMSDGREGLLKIYLPDFNKQEIICQM